MAKLRAAVLAAGRGIRMGGGTPKTLLPVDGGRPLLHYILAGLETSGIDDLVVVTGHRASEIEKFVKQEWDTARVQFVRNMRYASWGNFHTVRLALDQSPGADVLVVNSDVIVHPDVYRRVASAPGDLVLAVEPRRRLDPEDMRVELSGSRLLAIGKDLGPARSHAEFAGVSLVRPDAARAYGDAATRLEWAGETSGYYEDVYGALFPLVEARAVAVRGGNYAEVDEPGDMKAAAAVVERHRDEWARSQAGPVARESST